MFSAYGSILSAIAPIFLLLFLGWLMRDRKVLTGEADKSLMQLVVKLFYPCLILHFIVGNPALQETQNLIIPPLIGFGTIVIGFLIANKLGHRIGLKVGIGLRSFSFTNGIYNYGYIPIPLMIALFPGETRILGVLMVFNVGVEMAIWTVGIIMLSGKFTLASLKKIINPPVIALVVGLIINFTGLDAHQPAWLAKLVRMLGDCSIPLGILLAGAMLSDLKVNPALFKPVKVSLAACGLRLLILPVIFIAMALWIPHLSGEMQIVLIIQAAMPAGIFPLVIATHYGGDPRVAAQVIFSTTAISLFTIPLWVSFGLGLL
jgi:predicted permease